MRTGRRSFRVFVMIAVMAGLGAMYVDLASLDRPLLKYFGKGPPAFGGLDVFKTCLIAVGSGSLVAAVVQFGMGGAASTRPKLWDDSGTLHRPSPHPITERQLSASVKQLGAALVVLMSALFVTVFVVTPQGFSAMGREDRPVELASAAMLLLSSAMFLYVAVVAFRRQRPTQRRFVLVALAFAFVFFLIGMEEMSWFQRSFGIETPELFEGNEQGELNLHNFVTRPAENLYYFSAFALLIGVPFLVDHGVLPGDNAIVSTFAPSLWVALVAALFVPYNYEMWNGSFTQLAFFVTLFVLAYYAWVSRRDGDDTRLLLAVLALVVLSQTVFLVFGDRLIRSNDLTEYKEFLIPISYLLYTLEVVGRVRSTRPISLRASEATRASARVG